MGHNLSLLHRLTASSQSLDAAQLESEVENMPCCKMTALTLGETATVGGRLRAVTYTPTENVPILEAELYDGSSAITLVFLGRRRIPGIEPGRKLMARGRVGEYDGRLAIYNPWYELKCPG